jgi:hypothetical protein
MQVFAQQDLGRIGGVGLGPFGNIAPDAVAGLRGITNIASSIIGMMTIAAAIWFFFQFTIGGWNWITSGGDKAKLEGARNRITHAAVGLIIVVAGWAILAVAGQLFGYNILIDPAVVIPQLGL